MKGTRGVQFLRAVALLAALLTMETGAALVDDPGSAAALRSKYVALEDHLSHNQFNRPLYMDSHEGLDGVTGEIYALIDYPFAAAGATLNKASQWCNIVILHLNTKFCRAATDNRGTVLQVSIGKKTYQPVDEAYRLEFVYRVTATTPAYLQVQLNADEGPLGTRDYRIVLEAAPAKDGQTFLRLSYSYAYGRVGRLAMQAYLATIGRNKVGFTVTSTEPDGQPHYIGGMRGVVERNTMRYYLAIEAFLGALSAPSQVRLEKSLRDCFAASARYPRQLYEMEQGEYLEIKRREYSRQQADAIVRTGSVAEKGG